MSLPPVVILGVPRSGTTWVQDVLGGCADVRTVPEPDNETRMPWPLVAKAGLGRFPLLRPGDRAPRYERLWRAACCGGGDSARVLWARERQLRWLGVEEAEAACDPERRLGLEPQALAWVGRPRIGTNSTNRVIVKSVHAGLCADWVAERVRPAILLVQRDPFEVLASWRAMATRSEGLEYAGRPERILSPTALQHLSRRYGPIPVARDRAVTWLAAGLMSELRAFAARREDAVVIDFDEACGAPRRTLAAAAKRLGLRWSSESERVLAARNRPGTGWDTTREAAHVPGGWRRRVGPAVATDLDTMLSRFELLSPHARSPNSP
jgi:Sulfotransferase family